MSRVRQSSARIAIATCTELPFLDDDGPALVAALAARDIVAEPAIWDDATVNWASYELVLVRNTWDYVPRRDEFVAWAYSLVRVANPAPILQWTTDKTYLAELSAAGVPVVPTLLVAPGDPVELPSWGEYVVKPTISAGAGDTARWRRGIDDEPASAQVTGLLAAGRMVMLQPYLNAVDVAGESALIYLGGRFSHSVRKGPILTAGELPEPLSLDDHGPRGTITPRSASAGELAAAQRVLDAVPGDPADLLYARVDLLPGDGGEPLLLELELSEPNLFLWSDPAAAGRLADAVVVALG